MTTKPTESITEEQYEATRDLIIALVAKHIININLDFAKVAMQSIAQGNMTGALQAAQGMAETATDFTCDALKPIPDFCALFTARCLVNRAMTVVVTAMQNVKFHEVPDFTERFTKAREEEIDKLLKILNVETGLKVLPTTIN